jgi:hypothetical protein
MKTDTSGLIPTLHVHIGIRTFKYARGTCNALDTRILKNGKPVHSTQHKTDQNRTNIPTLTYPQHQTLIDSRNHLPPSPSYQPATPCTSQSNRPTAKTICSRIAYIPEIETRRLSRKSQLRTRGFYVPRPSHAGRKLARSLSRVITCIIQYWMAYHCSTPWVGTCSRSSLIETATAMRTGT